MKAIRVRQTGGPEVLESVDADKPAPGARQALVRIEAIGVNFIDVYHRTGLYKLALPFTPGSEAAGVVEAVGEGVTRVRAGDRVAYAMVPGAYAEYAGVPEERLIVLPAGIDAKIAAATMLQGMTAHYLAVSTFPLREGHTALVHAAAGGVGALLVQIARQRGARVFGTASTKHLGIAREAGADLVIDYTTTDFEDEVMRATDGRGADVVYDSVGRTTFDKSLAVHGRRGMLVLFGQSSGPVAPVDPGAAGEEQSLSQPAEPLRILGDVRRIELARRRIVRLDRRRRARGPRDHRQGPADPLSARLARRLLNAATDSGAWLDPP